MSNTEAFLPSNSLLGSIPYYPLMVSSSSGHGVSGTDTQLTYEAGTLTTPNLDVVNINGYPYVPLGNVVNTLFPKIKLTSTWVAYGDSYTDAGAGYTPDYTAYLSAKTSTTAIKKAKSGTTTEYLTSAYASDPVLNPAYANYSSIVFYGFNDVCDDKNLFDDLNGTIYMQMVLATTICLSVPQNKIQNPRIADATWTKSGSWSDTPVYSFGVRTGTNGDYIEKNIGTARYIAVTYLVQNAIAYDWDLRVNGVSRAVLSGTAPTGSHATTANYYFIGTIIDLGVDTPNCIVRVVNNAPTSLPSISYFVNFVAGWTSADFVNARNVLHLSIPRFNYQYATTAPRNDPSNTKRIFFNECREVVARTCRLAGLPVTFYNINEGAVNLISDKLHPNTYQSQWWADEIVNNAIYL